jgi:L-ascorbate metabolism protein UlaG (beta-lactamase superfamily)
MVITYFGKSYFKLTLGDLTIAINPPAKDSKNFPKPPRFGADIALISLNHTDYNGVDTVTLGDKEPFPIDGPGSYEVKDLLFTGVALHTNLENKEYINTVYGFELDGIKIALLGAITDETALTAEAKEVAGNADMIFVPVGDASGAYKIANSFGPNMIIPYDYTEASLAKFLKEGGQDKNEMQDKATLKRRDLDGKEGYILILAPQA